MCSLKILWNSSDQVGTQFNWRFDFFLRELELEVTPFDPKSSKSRDLHNLIYTDYNNLSEWSHFLRNCPKASVSIILGGNEYYAVDPLVQLQDFPSIRRAFIQYLPKKILFPPLLQLAKEITQDHEILFARNFYSVGYRSLRRFRSLRRLTLEVPYSPFPLGYTNRFVRELRNLNILTDGSSSLYGPEMDETIYGNAERSKKNKISFFGQKGSWLRRRQVDEFSKFKEVDFETYAGWGGIERSTATQYAKSMLEARFVLCPPGNVSNESFRYYEAIALGALPIVGSASIQDWVQFDYWPKYFGFKYQTARDLWLKLKNLSYSEYVQLSKAVRKLEKEKLDTLARDLRG